MLRSGARDDHRLHADGETIEASRAKDRQRGRPDVGGLRGGGRHGDRRDRVGRAARAGVDNVAVAYAGDLDRPGIVAAGADGRLGNLQRGEISVAERILDVDIPLPAGDRPAEADQVAADLDHPAVGPGVMEQGRGPVDRVALGDAAEIDSCRRAAFDGTVVGQFDPLPAGSVPGGGQFGVVGCSVPFGRTLPQFDQRPASDVEGTAGRYVGLLGGTQHVERLR